MYRNPTLTDLDHFSAKYGDNEAKTYAVSVTTVFVVVVLYTL